MNFLNSFEKHLLDKKRKINFQINSKENNENILKDSQDLNSNIFQRDFKKRKKLRKKRKFKPDDIRKKIKARFHKTIKNIINENLKLAGSKELFDFLPQSFVCNITRDKNKEIMGLTYKQLLEKDFTKDFDKIDRRQKKIDLRKIENNIKVLNYLKKNPQISIKSGFDAISGMTYANILKEYFSSDEFEESIIKLKNEEENEEYIREYRLKAKTYVEFFCNDNIENQKGNVISNKNNNIIRIQFDSL